MFIIKPRELSLARPETRSYLDDSTRIDPPYKNFAEKNMFSYFRSCRVHYKIIM